MPKKDDKRSSGGAKIKGFVRDLVDSSIRDAYSIKIGYILTMALAVLLWWVPMFGPMIAGYVGGRKSGTPLHGLVSTGAAALTMFAFAALLSIGMLSGQSIAASLSTAAAGTVFEPATQYITSLFTAAGNTAVIGLDPLVVMVVMGLIGGFMANQVRREAEMLATAGSAGQTRRMRTLDLYQKGKRIGFESFDEYSAISVNTMAPAEPAPRAAVAPQEAPVRAPVQAKPSAVTTTAEMRVATTSTSSESSEESQAEARDNPFAGIVAKGAPRDDPDKSSSGNDFEYI